MIALSEFVRLLEHVHVPSVLIRQIKQYGEEKSMAHLVLLRQLVERTKDLEACDSIADTITNNSWGMF